MPARVAALVTAGVLAACGARLDPDQLATSASGDGTGVEVASAGASAATVTTVAAAGAPVAAAAVPVGGAPAAGGGSAGETAAASEAACTPSGAPEVGVTETEITWGQVGTISGPVPGLSQTAAYGVRAYVAYRNATGGVCGRQLRVVQGDDRLDSGQNRAEHLRLMPQVLGFVGGWSVTDDGGAAVLAGTNVPDVGIAISDARAGMANNYSTNPIPLDGTSGTGTILRHMRDTYQPTSAAVVWGAQSVARARAQGFVRDLEALGLPVVVAREVAITETNYVSVAQEIENAQAGLVITALEITGIARLAQAFQQVGYLPTVPFYGAQSYGTQFIELAGTASEGAILGLTHPILEEAGSNPQVALMLEWYERTNPGAPIDFFSFQGWVAADLFADAIEAAGPSPTRDAVLAELATITSFDADGLVAPFDPAGKLGAECFMIVTVRDGVWQREHPQGGGFACP